MAIPKGHKTNLETLVRAAENGDLAIMECQRSDTGKIVNVICAVSFDGNEYTMTPFAELYDGNPYDVLNPPNPDGGFVAAEK